MRKYKILVFRNHWIGVDPKICPNFIFTLILSPILSLDFKSQLHVIFFTHSTFNS